MRGCADVVDLHCRQGDRRPWGGGFVARCLGYHWIFSPAESETVLSRNSDQCVWYFDMCRPRDGWCIHRPSVMAMVLLDVSNIVVTLLSFSTYLQLARNKESNLGISSNLPLGAVAVVLNLCFLRLHNTDSSMRSLDISAKIKQLDIPGALILVASLVCLILALQWGGLTKSWSSTTIIGLLIGFGLLLILFVFVQWKSDSFALIPFRLFRQRSIFCGTCFLFFFGTMNYVVSFLRKPLLNISRLKASHSILSTCRSSFKLSRVKRRPLAGYD